MYQKWLSERSRSFDASGIRKVFDLAAKLDHPINLSIGQPDFDAPEEAKEAAINAILSRKNGYTPTQGAAELRQKVQQRVDQDYGSGVREAVITSGTSGALMLTLMAMVNPGDEIILFDPYFVMYEALVKMLGGIPIFIETYPDFQLDVNKVRDAITPKTKLILFNSPANPTGTVATEEICRDLALLAKEKNIALISDEIYRFFCYDGEFTSPAKYNSDVIVLDGFSKCYGIPGWRIGFAHGPSAIMQQILKFQQYSFVCAPSALQYGSVAAMDTSMDTQFQAYRRKRNLIYEGLKDYYEIAKPGGAFYAFPKVPTGDATEFITRAIQEHQLLAIPGNVFSSRNTHFRLSFAATDETIEKGVEILQKMAKNC
ncbi:MAG: aminotransferase class I/II-fold pyridoxal phosphate-dependent enzyme [Planctomycetia bacterium]|nr:aminotransferase class I/II-fold pyridoxal phosphate-dependent enzyme [Planctomycetia bacterium]